MSRARPDRPSTAAAARDSATVTDDGNAVVEFLALALVLLIPVVYLVVALGRLQAAVFATESGAREAARVYAGADDPDDAAAAATTAVGLALGDQGFAADPTSALSIGCSAVPCLTPGGAVTATVTVDVELPLVPAFLRDALPLSVPVSTARTAVVGAYRDLG